MVGRFVEGIPGIFAEAASFIMMCAGKERKAVHDWIAGTVVLHDPNKILARWLRRRIRLEAPHNQPGYVVIGFHWADEQTVQLEGTTAEIPQDHPAVTAVNPASSTCSTAWYSGGGSSSSSSLPNPQARPRAICGLLSAVPRWIIMQARDRRRFHDRGQFWSLFGSNCPRSRSRRLCTPRNPIFHTTRRITMHSSGALISADPDVASPAKLEGLAPSTPIPKQIHDSLPN